MTDKHPISDAKIRTLRRSDIDKCPFLIMLPNHYREDGSCKCSNAEHRKMMISEWGYTPRQFRNVPLVD